MFRIAALPLSFLLVVATASMASATHTSNPPPFGYSCIGDYNPSAYTNVCFYVGPVPTVTIGDRTTCVYVIGNLPGCQTHDYPFVSCCISFPGLWIQIGCNPSTIHATGCQTLYLL